MLDTLFALNLRMKISGEDAVLLRNYLREQTKSDDTIGHLLEPFVQTMVDDLVRKASLPEEERKSG